MTDEIVVSDDDLWVPVEDRRAERPAPTATAELPVSPVALALTVVAAALWVWGASRVEPGAMSDAGLISVLGWPVLLSFVVLAVAAALALARPGPAVRLLTVQSILLVVMVHGLPAVIEAQANYFTAYLHVGFVEEIVRTGRTVPNLDARFSWPGSFGFGALITAVGGVDSARYYLRWAPVLFHLAYLAPLRLIARSVLTDERARWLAMWLVVAANWVHQDYYSPQAEAYFLYLVVIAVVLRWFGGPARQGAWPRPGRVPRLLAPLVAARDRWSAADRPPRGAAADPRTATALIAVLVLLLGTIVVSHQLTPVSALLVLGALVLVDRCSIRHLPILVALLFAGWFSVGASGYWLGHLAELTGGAGDVGRNVNAGLFGRIGGDATRAWVLRLRMGLSGALLGGAFLVALHRWRQGRPPLALLALLLPPFALVVGQSYGGEVLLRSYLFALPAAALLVAPVITGARRGLRPERAALVAAVLAVALLAGVTARFGNERFELVGSEDLAAVEWVYEHVPTGSVLIAPARNLPWRYQELTAYRYKPDEEFPLTTAREVLALVPDDAPAFLVTTDEQQLFGAQLYFLPNGWLDRLVAELEATGRLTVLFRDGDAVVRQISPTGVAS